MKFLFKVALQRATFFGAANFSYTLKTVGFYSGKSLAFFYLPNNIYL